MKGGRWPKAVWCVYLEGDTSLME